MHVKIDETGRKIISGKINNLFASRLRSVANRGDFSLVNNEPSAFEPMVALSS